MMTRRILCDIVVFSFIALFVYAAMTKLMEFQKFNIQLSQSPILTRYASAVAWIVPVFELGISLLIIPERTRLIGLYSAFGMMVMFTTYIVLASRFSDYVPCSCGGVIENLTWTEHLVFNIAFVLLGILGILLHPGPGTSNNTPAGNVLLPGGG